MSSVPNDDDKAKTLFNKIQKLSRNKKRFKVGEKRFLFCAALDFGRVHIMGVNSVNATLEKSLPLKITIRFENGMPVSVIATNPENNTFREFLASNYNYHYIPKCHEININDINAFVLHIKNVFKAYIEWSMIDLF